MILLRLISWPYVRKHIVRTMLTTAGIVLGVAVFVGMHAANESVLFAFNRTVDQIAGRTQLQVSAGETGFNEQVLDTVQDTPAVGIAVPVIEVPPTCRAKFATGRGNASKSEVVSAISARTGILWDGVGNEDRCDAWILQEMGFAHMGHARYEWPATHLAALDKVDWDLMPVGAEGAA